MRRRVTLLGVVLALVVLGTLLLPRPLLQTEVVQQNADIGIPGITKMYEAWLINRGFWPVRIVQCDFVSDTNEPGSLAGYRLERWNNSKREWNVVVDMNGPDLCTPHPLAYGNTQLSSHWLWPGQRLGIGEEATAAHEGLRRSDVLRYSVYLETGNPMSPSVPSEQFIIDEEIEFEIPFRIKH